MCPLVREQQPLSEPQGAFSYGQSHLWSQSISDAGHTIPAGSPGARGHLDAVLNTQPP